MLDHQGAVVGHAQALRRPRRPNLRPGPGTAPSSTVTLRRVSFGSVLKRILASQSIAGVVDHLVLEQALDVLVGDVGVLQRATGGCSSVPCI